MLLIAGARKGPSLRPDEDSLAPGNKLLPRTLDAVGLASHLAQALEVLRWFLEGMCCCRGELRTVFRMPLRIFLLRFRPVSRTSSIRRHIKGLDLVHIMMVHAPLCEDILAPCTKLPIATVVGARCKLFMAILQVFRQDLCGRVAYDLEVSKEPILDIRAILVVETVWRVSRLAAQPIPQALRDEDRISIKLHGVICRLPLAYLADLDPHLVEGRPIDPCTCPLAPDLVELAKSVLDLDAHIPCRTQGHRHIGKHVPLVTRKDTGPILVLLLQQVELKARLGEVPCVLGVHGEAIQLLPERSFQRHRVRCDNVTSETFLACCACLVALRPPCHLCEALAPRDLAAPCAVAILPGLGAGREAGFDDNPLLLALHTIELRGDAILSQTSNTHERCHTCRPCHQACPPTTTILDHMRLKEELILTVGSRHCDDDGVELLKALPSQMLRAEKPLSHQN